MKSGKGTQSLAVRSRFSPDKSKTSLRPCTGRAGVQAAKYLCRQCAEQFDLLGDYRNKTLRCPRCSSAEVDEYVACKIGIGPPPWTFKCLECGCEFLVQSPTGPDEAKSIRCPVCAGKKVKWQALGTQTCPSGG